MEGNRRLCVYRKLRELEGNPEGDSPWSRIPCKVITQEISREEIFSLLGTLHIKGKAEWKPVEQAGFIYREKHEFAKTNEEIASMIGLKAHNVVAMLRAYELMREFEVKDPEKYSYYLEYAKSPKFSKIKEKQPDLDAQVSKLIVDGRIPIAQDVRKLAGILEDKKAAKQFVVKNDDFASALETAYARNPEQIDTFYKRLSDVRVALRSASVVRIVQDIKDDHTKKSKLAYFFRDVEKFAKAIRWDKKGNINSGGDE